MPPKVISYDAELAREAYQLAEAWHHADVMGIGISEAPKSVQEKDLSQWAPDQVSLLAETLTIWDFGSESCHDWISWMYKTDAT